jgi:hypothetical protein
MRRDDIESLLAVGGTVLWMILTAVCLVSLIEKLVQLGGIQ